MPAAGAATIGVVMVLSAFLVPQPEGGQPPPPSPSCLEEGCVMAAALGITPESLGAAGYSDAIVPALFAELHSRHAVPNVDAVTRTPGRPRLGAPTPTEPASANTENPAAARDALRASVLSSLGGSAQDAERVATISTGITAGLPADIAAGCATKATRQRIAAALLRERRAQRFDAQLSAADTELLATVRSSAAVVAARENLQNHLPALQAQFAASSQNSPTP